VRYYADLHVHSKYSRACSRDCDVRNLTWWARRKGITVLGTGDFTHPAWAQELRETLEPAEPGLFRLRDDVDTEVLRKLPPTLHGEVRFMLEVEISTIYKRDDRTRKVHHLCYVPSFEAADRFTAALARIGNLGSDGRPILGLDSRDLLEITLESGEGSYLVPAHVWTPWFAVLGSKSGFDAVADCYADLADEVFAVETGLSSDPTMNWRVSGLDSYTLVSNSDAHSPPILGRNATVFDTELSYFALRDALRDGNGYVGTVDMFPEEGKYFLDGHRKCDVRMDPAETKKHKLQCPECRKPLTVGVLHRIEELADRGPGKRPKNAGDTWNIVPLPEIMGEILKVGPKSKAVNNAVTELVTTLGPELPMLLELPLDELKQARNPMVHEAISRLRAGQVHCDPGFDGEYGTISVFSRGETSAPTKDAPGLFDMPAPEPVIVPRRTVQVSTVETTEPEPEVFAEPGALLDGLDPDQRAAASIVEGQLLVVAGPGTGKTRTLTHRIAHLVQDHGVDPASCLAITFTRRAAEEMRERLAALVDGDVNVATFHQFGLQVLREQHERLGLAKDFGVADEPTRLAVLREILGEGSAAARRVLQDISRTKRVFAARMAASAAGELPIGDEIDGDLIGLVERYDKAMLSRDLVDFDDLLAMPVTLLSRQIDLVEHYRARYRWICVDEYQDVDELQYRLLQELTPPHGNLCAIGDPDQAIYSFRGADVGFFLRFQRDFPAARTVQLTRNYRSSPVIVAGAVAAIKPTTLVPDRELQAMRAATDDKIGIFAAADEDAEAHFVVRTIEELLGGSSFHAHDSGRVSGDGVRGGLSFDDIAVLYRTDAQAGPVMEALSREGLPFQKRSHSPLAGHPGVQELLRHFTPGPQPTAVLLKQAALRASDDLADEVQDALELLKPLAAKHDPARFLAELSLGAEVDTWDPRANRISLLTLHAAKGLEFPVVFIVGCVDGLLPMRWAEELDEERRLFFVGVSRAQTHLYLSHAARRGVPSPFLKSLGSSLVERLAGRPATRSRQLRLL
jgi:DNA helicase-2/ATP-dependent DNA helicase PcrA